MVAPGDRPSRLVVGHQAEAEIVRLQPFGINLVGSVDIRLDEYVAAAPKQDRHDLEVFLCLNQVVVVALAQAGNASEVLECIVGCFCSARELHRDWNQLNGAVAVMLCQNFQFPVQSPARFPVVSDIAQQRGVVDRQFCGVHAVLAERFRSEPVRVFRCGQRLFGFIGFKVLLVRSIGRTEIGPNVGPCTRSPHRHGKHEKTKSVFGAIREHCPVPAQMFPGIISLRNSRIQPIRGSFGLVFSSQHIVLPQF